MGASDDTRDVAIHNILEAVPLFVLLMQNIHFHVSALSYFKKVNVNLGQRTEVVKMGAPYRYVSIYLSLSVPDRSGTESCL